ncbi:MAG TPA: DMT family transporter [Anaerolineae bacterium]
MAVRETEYNEMLPEFIDTGGRAPERSDRPAKEAVAARFPRQLAADLALLLVTMIWGGTFVMVKDAVAAYPVFTFLAVRFAFAAVALLPLALWRRRRAAGPPRRDVPRRRTPLATAAPLVGIALFAGYGFQTLGLHLTTPAKAGFITGLGVVVVPVVAAVFLRQRPGVLAWLGVAMATAGLAFLSWQPGAGINPGDALVFCCALSFAAHILLTGRFASRVDPLLLTLGQIVTVVVLSGVASLAFENPPPLTSGVIFAAAFTGLLATSAAFGVQTLAQRFTTTTHTALIFAAEPVFAALFSFLLIGEALGPRQFAGCGLILAGMLAAELKLKPGKTDKPVQFGNNVIE